MSDADEGAILMRMAAEKAALAGREAIVRSVEASFPVEDATGLSRQLGAIITATSMVYGTMLEACAQDGRIAESILAAGMLKSFIARPLEAMAKLARGSGVEVRGVNHNRSHRYPKND